MKHIYGFLLFSWLAVEQITGSNNDMLGIALLLCALCLFIIKERYIDNVYSSAAFFLLAMCLSLYDVKFALLCGVTMLDLAYLRKYIACLLIFAVSMIFCMYYNRYECAFYFISSGLFGYIVGLKDKNEKKYLFVLDEERRLRYNLELVRNELVKSRKEIERFTEIRERNRIAHEIHDNIGHNIAGVIFQLEAAIRVFKKDNEKAGNIIHLCSRKLAETLELTRNTVHNIRVDKKIGADCIKEIISEFRFCNIDFNYSGDFNMVSSTNMSILEANIMESLTNASKYSYAKNINIRIDIGMKNIRLYYKDDGVGCENIRENMGILGMRERMEDIGGTISIDGSKGFLIVCNLPVRTAEEGRV